MNRRAQLVLSCLTTAATACLFGLILSSGGGCNRPDSPAITSPAHASSGLNKSPSEGALGGSSSVESETELSSPPKPAEGVAAKDITFDSLKFDIKAGDPFARSMIPKQTEDLHGRPVRIRGYIHPQFAFMETLTGFILTRDSDTCCFGPNRALCDFVVVHMNPGKTATYSLYPVAVEGVFTIEELIDPADPDGAVGAIYRLDADLAR